MENQIDKKIKYLQAHLPNIRLNYHQNSFSDTLKHYTIFDSNNIKGFASGHSSSIVFDKAFSEYVERLLVNITYDCFGLFETSNGFSAHPIKELAIENSINELIERDAFLNSWHANVSPFWINEIDLIKFLNYKNIEIYETHKKNKLNLQLGIIAKTDDIFTCIAMVNPLDQSKAFFYIDTASGKNLSEVFNKLIEGISFFSHFVFSNKKNIFSSSNKPNSPIAHFLYYLKKRNNLDWFFNGKESILELPMEPYIIHTINPVDYVFLPKKLHRYVAIAESSKMQNYYCGFPNKKNINIDRLRRIFGNNIQINKQVHPLS